MASVAAIYQRKGDNVAVNATITIETGVSTGDSNYAPASLVDGNPAKPAKINSTTAAWLFDFGSAQRIDIVALIHHNFDAGADVKIQGNATNSWGAPTFSMSFTIPTWFATGTSQRWPINPWLDLTTSGSYSASGFRYWRLVITSNSQNVQLGEIWMGSSIRRFTKGLQWGLTQRYDHPVIEHRTSFQVGTFYDRNTTVYRLESPVWPNDAFMADLREHWHTVGGRAYPWLLVPDGTQNVCYLVRWLTPLQELEAAFINGWRTRVQVEEAGRGLRLGN